VARRGGPRSVLITGASTGIGFACATHLAERGWTVFAGVRRAEDAQRLVVSAARGALTPVLLDVTSITSLERSVREVDAALAGSGLGALVNNAGVVGSVEPLEFQALDAFRATLEVNLIGTLATTQAFLPLLRRARGRVINMGSLQGWQAVPFAGGYAATKWALVGLTQVLRLELAPWGLAASVVEPGIVETPIWRKASEPLAALAASRGPVADRYGKWASTLEGVLARARQRGISARAVARAVERVLRARRPRLRYVVGAEARAIAWGAGFAPSSLRDPLLRAYFRIPRLREPS
jgi:NAD(P)-dependent dehydrogenase (short-subunit alcohol dehydrogenase family)